MHQVDQKPKEPLLFLTTGPDLKRGARWLDCVMSFIWGKAWATFPFLTHTRAKQKTKPHLWVDDSSMAILLFIVQTNA